MFLIIVMVHLFDLIFFLLRKLKNLLLMVFISNLSDKSQSAHLFKETESSALWNENPPLGLLQLAEFASFLEPN